MLTPEQRQLRDAAADLLERSGWCKGVYAEDARGRAVQAAYGTGEDYKRRTSCHPDAVSFCAIGAATRAAGRPLKSEDLGADLLSTWNDAGA